METIFIFDGLKIAFAFFVTILLFDSWKDIILLLGFTGDLIDPNLPSQLATVLKRDLTLRRMHKCKLESSNNQPWSNPVKCQKNWKPHESHCIGLISLPYFQGHASIYNKKESVYNSVSSPSMEIQPDKFNSVTLSTWSTSQDCCRIKSTGKKM